MTQGVNKIILIGHCGGDPDIRATSAGRKMASLSLATSRSWRDKTSGDRRDQVQWHRVVVFAETLVGVVEQFCRKGSRLYVAGELLYRNYTDRDGIKRVAAEIVLNDFRGELTLLDRRNGDRPPPADGPEVYDRAATGAPPQSLAAAIDDDIQF